MASRSSSATAPVTQPPSTDADPSPGVSTRRRQPSVAELADRLGRRHVGAVLGTLDLASDRIEIVGRGRVRLPDGTQPGPDTLFEIGSITKTFTSLALAVLAESGTVRLGTPLRDLLPTGTAVPSRDGKEITLEHLARHTSGLPRTPNRMLREIRAVLRGENPYDMDEFAALESLKRVSLKHTPGRGPRPLLQPGRGPARHRAPPGRRSQRL